MTETFAYSCRLTGNQQRKRRVTLAGHGQVLIAYVQWVRRYLKFQREVAGAWKHPRELGPTDVVAFLNHLAKVENVAAGTQNQALNGSGRFAFARPLRLGAGKSEENIWGAYPG